MIIQDGTIVISGWGMLLAFFAFCAVCETIQTVVKARSNRHRKDD